MKDEKSPRGEGGRLMRAGSRLASVGIPADADCRIPLVTLTGDRYVKVEHHRGVLLLTKCCVRLYSGLGIIRIEGKELAAASMDDDVLLLDGCVKSVSFE